MASTRYTFAQEYDGALVVNNVIACSPTAEGDGLTRDAIAQIVAESKAYALLLDACQALDTWNDASTAEISRRASRELGEIVKKARAGIEAANASR